MTTKTEYVNTARIEREPDGRRDEGENLIPPLENGDHLRRPEFERRYNAMPDVKKAELIEGKVYMPSPVRFVSHAEPHSFIITWLVTYYAGTPHVRVGDNATVRIDVDNEVQPDAMLLVDPAVGGTSRIDNDDYIEGVPELVVEIAASSASYDLHEKRNVYRRIGVKEYLVWRVYDRQFDWWRLEEGEYIVLPPNGEGMTASQVFPGLWLAVNALLEKDMATVLATLQRGLASPEHAAFVQTIVPAATGGSSEQPEATE